MSQRPFSRQGYSLFAVATPVPEDASISQCVQELAHRQEEAGYQLTAKEARVVANLQTTMSNMGNIFFLVGLVGSALLTRSRPKKNRWWGLHVAVSQSFMAASGSHLYEYVLCRVRWPMCFSVALLGQEHANNTAPFAVIGSLASMDSPVGGEVRELARERLPGPAVKLVLRFPPPQATASLPCAAASTDTCCLQG